MLELTAAFFADPPRLLQLDMLLRMMLQIFLFSASAFFSGSETALFSLSRFDLQKLSRENHPAADKLHSLLDQPRRLIVSVLCGNELVNIAAAANMTAILVELLGVEAATIAATFVMIPLILLIGEVTPKTIAVSNPVWASTRIVVTPLYTWTRLIKPLAVAVRAVADRITTLLIGPERTRENILYLEELRSLIEEGVESGEISSTARSLINSLLRAGATEVREIMTPRPQLGFIDGELNAEERRQAFIALRHPRAPVFVGNHDNVVGFLYVEDFLQETSAVKKAGNTGDFRELHPPVAVPSTKEVDEMLDFFEENQARAALVVNEFGGVDGIVSLDDVTRFLFEGIYDDPVIDVDEIRAIEGGYEIEASTPLSEIRQITGMDIPDSMMSTIAGTALRNFGVVPEIGDQINIEGLTLEIVEMDNLRIAKVRLLRKEDKNGIEEDRNSGPKDTDGHDQGHVNND